MNACPDCESPLPQTATSCRCGWTLQRISTDTQGRDEVLERQLAEHAARAAKSLEEKGLARRPGEPFEDWRKRSIKWLREQAGKIGKHAA